MWLIADGIVKNWDIKKQLRFEEINHDFIDY